MSTGSTCFTAAATSRRSRRARKPSNARRRSSTARFVNRAVLRVADPIGGVGEGKASAGRREVQNLLDVPPAVEAVGLVFPPVAAEEAPADIRRERRPPFVPRR